MKDILKNVESVIMKLERRDLPMKIKTLISCLLMVMLLAVPSFAAMPSIHADHQYFDISTGLHTLSGNVSIAHNGRTITAGEAKTNLLEVWASGGITLVQDDIYFTGSDLYASFTQNQVQITGGVNFSRSGLTITANQGDFNWKSKVAVFSGNVAVTQNGNTWTADSVSYHVIDNTFL